MRLWDGPRNRQRRTAIGAFRRGRNPLSVAEKNAVGSRRAAWRVVTSVEQKENTEGIEEQAASARKFVVEVEAEHKKVCDGILALTDENLCPWASTGEPKALQRQAAMIQEVLKTVEFPQVQYVDEIVHEPVVMRGQVPTTQTVQKTVEASQVQFPDRVADVPVVSRRHVPGPSIQGEIVEVIRVVDSEDLPLNISREVLLQNKILRVIVTKYLEILAEIAELNDDYKKFYERCVKCMKLGIRENSIDDVEALRFNTFKSGDEQFSFEEYVDRMKEGQNDMCYITDESIAVVSSSSFLENLRKNGYEVPYMADPVDEFAVRQPKEFDGTKPKPTTKKGSELGDQDQKKMLDELRMEPKPLRIWMRYSVTQLRRRQSGSSTVASVQQQHGWRKKERTGKKMRKRRKRRKARKKEIRVKEERRKERRPRKEVVNRSRRT